MLTQDLVLVDTCMWTSFFNRPQSDIKQAIDALLDEDRVALIGPILAEVLCGFHRDEQADRVASTLRGNHFIYLDWDDWRRAARLHRSLASRGHQLPLSDLALAVTAQRLDCAVYSNDRNDPHFDLIPNLKRYEPASAK